MRREESSLGDMNTGWGIGTARHKLVDHWRRQGRQERGFRVLSESSVAPGEADPWDAHLDSLRARDTLASLAVHHRTVLTLRYVDDLPVADVAQLVGRTVHATEALLVRSRSAFRGAYEKGGGSR